MLTLDKSEAVIRSNSMRVTPQRRAVVEFLEGNRNHPSVEDVAKHVQLTMPNVALSTVYNILHELFELDLVSKVEVGGAMRFDPQELPHAHFYCRSCETVFDVDLEDELIGNLFAGVAEEGFVCEQASIGFSGLCKDCASE